MPKNRRPVLTVELLEERNAPTPWPENAAITLLNSPEPAATQRTDTAASHDFRPLMSVSPAALSQMRALAAPAPPVPSLAQPIPVVTGFAAAATSSTASPAPEQELVADFLVSVTDLFSGQQPLKRNPLRPQTTTDPDPAIATGDGGLPSGLPPDAAGTWFTVASTTSGPALPLPDDTTDLALAASAFFPAGTGVDSAAPANPVVPVIPTPGPQHRPDVPVRSLPPVQRPLPPGAQLSSLGDPLWGLDANKAIVITPGVIHHDFSTWNVDLRAEVSGATVATYNWNLSQAPDATNVTGQGTYRLQFTWASFTGAARTNTITVTTTNTDSTQQTQVLTFKVAATDSPAWSATSPTTAASWPTVVTPDALREHQGTVGAGPYYRLGLATGELQVSHTLPTYHPNVPPLELVYSSTASSSSNSLSFLVHYQLDPTRPCRQRSPPS